jgi:hypothetical protein
MSDGAPTQQQSIDYVARLLQMNPIHQGGDIVRARNEFLSLRKAVSDLRPMVANERGVDRRQLVEQLESIRARFWSAPEDELTKELSALRGHNFVDLEIAVSRLQLVAAYRPELSALGAKGGHDASFVSALEEILTRAPRDTMAVREQLLTTFDSRAQRKSGRRILKRLRTQMPAVYDLDADWFDALNGRKYNPAKGMLISTGTGGRPGRWLVIAAVVFWLVLLFIGIIDGLINNRK